MGGDRARVRARDRLYLAAWPSSGSSSRGPRRARWPDDDRARWPTIRRQGVVRVGRPRRAGVVVSIEEEERAHETVSEGARPDRGAALVLAAACSSSRRQRGASLGRVPDAGQVPAAVGRPVAVRRLLRGRRPGLLPGRSGSTSSCCSAARTSTTSRSSRPAAPTSARPGCRTCSSRARAAPTSCRSPRSSSAPGPGWPSFKAANITTPASMAGKKIGSWLGGNEPELFAAPDQGVARPDQGEHHQAELRHVGAAQGRPRRRPGDDLQRVRPGPRGQEPGHRPAVQAGRPQRRRLQRPGGRDGDAPGPDLRHRQVAQDRQQRRRRRQVPRGHASRAGSTAGTTPRSASTSCSPRARSSAPATRPGR